MNYNGLVAGYKGCDEQVGSGTVTAPKNMKIAAIGIYATSNITNFKHTPAPVGGSAQNQKTVSDKGWMGSDRDANAVTAFIPLDYPADSVEIASGDIFVYYI